MLDRLLGHERYGRLIDARRIAAVGHSMGGAAAATTMLADARGDAGVNLDGSFQPALDRDLARPFLMLGTADHGAPGQHESWDETRPHLTGWRRWVHVPEMEHMSPSGVAVVGEWQGLPIQPLAGPSPRFPEVHFVGPPAG